MYRLFYKNIVGFFLCNNAFSLQFGMIESLLAIFPTILYGKKIGALLITDAVCIISIFNGVAVYLADYSFTFIKMEKLN